MGTMGNEMRDRARQRAADAKNRGSGTGTLAIPEGTDMLKAREGTMRLDVIPYRITKKTNPEVRTHGAKIGSLWYERTYWIHFALGVEEQMVICPKTIGQPCPVDEDQAHMRKDPNANEDEVKALRAKERQLFNVIDLDSPEKGIQLFECSYHLFGKLLEQEIREGDESLGGFADIEDGLTLKVRFSKAQMGQNAFLEATRIDFVPRKRAYPATILDEALDLDDILKVPTYEEIQAIYQPAAGETAEPEAPPARTVRPAAARPPPEADEPPADEPPAAEEPASNACRACEGTKKTTSGKMCPICWGTGLAEEAPADNEPPPPARKPAATTAAPQRQAARPPPPETEELPWDNEPPAPPPPRRPAAAAAAPAAARRQRG